MKIISAKEAKKRKLSRYYTGVPCVHGHLSERIVRNRRCRECAVKEDRERKASLKYLTNIKNIVRQRRRDFKKRDQRRFGHDCVKSLASLKDLMRLVELAKDDKGLIRCKVSNDIISLLPKDKKILSFDRLDNTRPHTKDNLRVTTWEINHAKGDHSLDTLMLVVVDEVIRAGREHELRRILDR